MAILHLGKTATSRSRKKKVVENTGYKAPPLEGFGEAGFISYLLTKGYSDTTAESFYSDLKKFQVWLLKQELEIENVQYNDMTAYLQSLAHLSQHTKGCYLRGIKQYFNYLISRNDRTDKPVEFIQLKGIKRKKLYDILNRKELDALYGNYTLPDPQGKDKNQNWFILSQFAQKRNKVILGLMLYQALDSRDIKRLTVQDVKLQKGKIFIPGTRRSNERELKLESLQILELMEYLLTTRKEMITLTSKRTDQLFISTGSGEQLHNSPMRLVKRLRTINNKVTSVKQLKASVIVHWLKIYNLRQVQYMAGHRYVSSTESFLMNEMDGMIEDIDKYHPTI